MVARTLDWRRSSAMVAAPSTAPKRPRTLVIMRCRAVNPTVVWDASMVQVPGVMSSIEAIWGALRCVWCAELVQLDCARKYSRNS